MKKIILLLTTLSCYSIQAQQQWDTVGVANIASNVVSPQIVINSNDVPYVLYENTVGQANVIKFDGTSWIQVGSPNFTPQCQAAFSSTNYSYLAIDNYDSLYVISQYWNSSSGYWGFPSVYKYNGNTWDTLFTIPNMYEPYNFKMIFDDNNLMYFVMQYNGSELYTYSPPNGVQFINSFAGQTSNIAIDTLNQPFLAYQDFNFGNAVTVEFYNGSSWQVLGTVGFNGVHVNEVSLAFNSNNVPYVSMGEINTSAYNITPKVAYFDGVTWQSSLVNSPISAWTPVSSNINFDHNDNPIVSFSTHGGGVTNKSLIKSYDGTSWNDIGNTSPFDSLLNIHHDINSIGEPYIVIINTYNSNTISVYKYSHIMGCTDVKYCNYDSTATYNDGSCNTVYGCTDSLATNYHAGAACDDGSCTYTSTCTNPFPTGAYVTELIHDRVRVNWDNMNDANCMVTQYRIKYRELGSSTWSQKTMANSGLCLFGLNTTSKKILGLTPSTTYEYYMKAWYCGGGASTWSAIQNFTTADECENVINFAVSTPTTTKAEFTWDTTGAYSFARIKLRVDTTGGVWTSAGGFGVFYPALTKEKNGLIPGTSYRAQARTWCDSTGGAYRSATWTPLVFWTQPTSIRLGGGSAINNLFIYPNPSRDKFNVSFISDTKQDLKVRIFNVIGEELINENLEQFIGEYTKQINLSNNAKGIYFLEIEMDDCVVNKKLILQ